MESVADKALRITEPNQFTSMFLTGFKVEVTDTFVRIVAFEDLPMVGYDGPERRINARMVMSNETAHRLIKKLIKSIGRT